MRFTKLRLAMAALGLVAVVGAAACDMPTASQQGQQVAVDKAMGELRTYLEGQKFQNVRITVEDETEAAATPAPSSTAAPGRRGAPKPSSSGSAKSAAAKKFKLLSALVRVPGIRCDANIEKRLDRITDPPYFDEVVTPAEPDGVEVPEGLREDPTPARIFVYVAQAHPECIVPGASGPVDVEPVPSPTPS